MMNCTIDSTRPRQIESDLGFGIGSQGSDKRSEGTGPPRILDKRTFSITLIDSHARKSTPCQNVHCQTHRRNANRVRPS
jgi:hypothetical protein